MRDLAHLENPRFDQYVLVCANHLEPLRTAGPDSLSGYFDLDEERHRQRGFFYQAEFLNSIASELRSSLEARIENAASAQSGPEFAVTLSRATHRLFFPRPSFWFETYVVHRPTVDSKSFFVLEQGRHHRFQDWVDDKSSHDGTEFFIEAVEEHPDAGHYVLVSAWRSPGVLFAPPLPGDIPPARRVATELRLLHAHVMAMVDEFAEAGFHTSVTYDRSSSPIVPRDPSEHEVWDHQTWCFEDRLLLFEAIANALRGAGHVASIGVERPMHLVLLLLRGLDWDLAIECLETEPGTHSDGEETLVHELMIRGRVRNVNGSHALNLWLQRETEAAETIDRETSWDLAEGSLSVAQPMRAWCNSRDVEDVGAQVADLVDDIASRMTHAASLL